MGAVNAAWKERRVLVPKEMFASNVSAPPKTFLSLLVALFEKRALSGDFGQGRWIHTAVPSLLPISVEVLRKKRERSGAVNITSTSPGFSAGCMRAFTDLKMSV